MQLDIDEDYARLIGTVAGLIAAALTVADCMNNGMLTAALHLGAVVIAFTVIRFTVTLSLRPRTTNDDDDDDDTAPDTED